MIKSRFAHCIMLDENCYAAYNSLIMEPVFLDASEYRDYLDLCQDNVDLVEALLSNHVYIYSAEQDNKALEQLKERVYAHSGEWDILYLIVTSGCNLACKYCFLDNNPNAEVSNAVMNKDTAIAALEKFACYGNRTDWENAYVLFYGGEPLLNFEVIKATIEYANSKNYRFNFSIITNATLLTDEQARFFSDYGVQIGISIDGPKMVNDKNRVYKNSNHSVYDRVTERINKLKEIKCGFSLSCTASPEVVEIAEVFTDWIKSLGVKNIYFNIYHYSEPSSQWEDHYPKMSEFMLNQYYELLKCGIYDGKCSEIMNNFIQKNFKHNNCGAIGRNQVAIAPNGDIFICQGDVRTKELSLGNIHVDDPTDLLKTYSQKEAWTMMHTINHNECLECEALPICGGGCPLQSEALFGNRESVDYASCMFYKTAMKFILNKVYVSSIGKV